MISSTILKCAEMSPSRKTLSAKERDRNNPPLLLSRPLYVSTGPCQDVTRLFANDRLGQDQARRHRWPDCDWILPDSLAGTGGGAGGVALLWIHETAVRRKPFRDTACSMHTHVSSGGQSQRRYYPNTHPCWRNQWPRWARGSGMFAGLSDAHALCHNRSKAWQHCAHSRDWMQKKLQRRLQHTKRLHVQGPRWTSELGVNSATLRIFSGY